FWVEPVFKAVFPGIEGCRCDRLPLTGSHVLKPPVCLFAERCAKAGNHNLFKVLLGVRSAGNNDLLCLSFPLGCGQGSGARNETDFLAHICSVLSTRNVHPKPNDPPFTALLDVTILTTSAAHTFSSSPLQWCRCGNISIERLR